MEISELRCPRDESPLTATTRVDAAGNECSSCAGFLIDATQIPALKELKRKKIVSLKVSTLNCPQCYSSMHEFSYRGVEIDICSMCRSVWLDPGEYGIFSKSNYKNEKNCDVSKEIAAELLLDNDSPISVTGFISRNTGILDFLGDALGSLLDAL